jgi:ABC-type uncharacterized transport system ATPase subunit
MTETAIRIENLTRDFGLVRAVDGLSLEMPAGIIFGFLGPNGAGKTTTINLLLGLLEPTSGRAEVLGERRGQPRVLRTGLALPGIRTAGSYQGTSHLHGSVGATKRAGGDMEQRHEA